MSPEAYYITAKELAVREYKDYPKEFISHSHLIYSSPAALSFNSPGAEGFGVKRAGLAIPDSIMLLVSPGCCGRNTASLGTIGKDIKRFYYLMMEETDIVTGRHLTRIPEAIKEICESLPKKPSMVMICITCADALLGTDLERVCKTASDLTGIFVRPCYMYALTREGRKPPMVQVRQSVYSLLSPSKKEPSMVNLLGYFSPLINNCELYELLKKAGFNKINEISRCKDYEAYQKMSCANFNLVLNPEARYAADDLYERLKIPYLELTRVYQLEKIKKQYELFGAALQIAIDDSIYYEKAAMAAAEFKEKHSGLKVAIGQTINANPYELAIALTQYGCDVKEIYQAPAREDRVYVKKLAKISPDTKIYSNLEPTMLYYEESEPLDVVLGKDSAYYHPEAKSVPFNEDIQPFGYAGLFLLLKQLSKGVDEK